MEGFKGARNDGQKKELNRIAQFLTSASLTED